MRRRQNDIKFLTLILAITGGYSDALTYVAANKLFSNHITGNLVLFAYHLITGTFSGTWPVLLSIPVFMFSVMAGGWIIEKYSSRHLFLFEGSVLVFGGILAGLLRFLSFEETTALKYALAMLSVSAMGMQSAFGKTFPKDTYGLTTMMTGNMVQLSLQAESYSRSRFKDVHLLQSLVRESMTVCEFLTGCMLGAYSGRYFGLAGMILPGVVLLLLFSFRSFSALLDPTK